MPKVLADGLVAVRVVLLGIEVCDVSGNFTQVTTTGIDGSADSRKTVADKLLVGSDRCGAYGFLTQVDAVAVGVGGCSCAVGGNQHLFMRVLAVLAGFR